MAVLTFAAVTGSLKTASETVKSMINLRDTAVFQAKAIELQGQISTALADAISAYEAQTAALQRVHTLEAEIASFETWDTEKGRYELKSVTFRGAMVFMLKPDARGSEPPHWLCPNCYQNRKKGFFQPTGAMLGRDAVYGCSSCKATFAAHVQPAWVP